MRLVLILIIVAMTVALPVGVLYTQSSSISRLDQGYEVVEIGDPEEVLTEIMGTPGIERLPGELKGITWVDSITSHNNGSAKSKSRFYRIAGISREVIWEFVIDADGRVEDKSRIE